MQNFKFFPIERGFFAVGKESKNVRVKKKEKKCVRRLESERNLERVRVCGKVS